MANTADIAARNKPKGRDTEAPRPSPSSSSTSPPRPTPPSKAADELVRPLVALGFKLDSFSPTLVTGHLTVTETCCQPFGVLHGGVSALVAEALCSIGAIVASGHRRVAGVQLTINHLRPARLGEHLVAEATPVSVGRTIQVWEARLWRVTDPADPGKRGPMLATSRLTALVSGTGNREDAGDAAVSKKLARL